MESKKDKPLLGKKILITRSSEQASELCTKLENLGAEIVHLPTIRILPPERYNGLDKAISELNKYDWIIFTSSNGVDSFFTRLKQKGKDLDSLSNTKICAIGPATAQKIESYNLKVDLEPKQFTSEEIVKRFKPILSQQGKLRILLPRSDIAPDLLPNELKKLGAEVKQVVAYRTVKERNMPRSIKQMLKNGQIDIITFTSSSTVKNFFYLIKKEELHPRIKFASIGPVTTKTVEQLDLKIEIQAREYTAEGLVKAILQNADYHR